MFLSKFALLTGAFGLDVTAFYKASTSSQGKQSVCFICFDQIWMNGVQIIVQVYKVWLIKNSYLKALWLVSAASTKYDNQTFFA